MRPILPMDEHRQFLRSRVTREPTDDPIDDPELGDPELDEPMPPVAE